MNNRIVLKTTLTETVNNVSDFLAAETGLSKARIKLAMNRGALRIKGAEGRFQLVRRATRSVPAGSILWLCYDPQLLSVEVSPSELVVDFHRYSVWFKPPGVLSQGSEWGDHCSLLRHVAQAFPSRKVFLIHRLDREACGLMMVAHDKSAASALTALFTRHQIEKTYRVRVQGVPEAQSGHIDEPVEGKSAVTRYQAWPVSPPSQDRDTVSGSCLLQVNIDTGRKHQIRVHLASIGHPVLGDKRYGQAHPDGLHLAAIKLVFECPFRHQEVRVELPWERVQQYWH